MQKQGAEEHREENWMTGGLHLFTFALSTMYEGIIFAKNKYFIKYVCHDTQCVCITFI